MRYEKNWNGFAGLLKKSILALTLILLALFVMSCGGLKNAKGTPVNPPDNIAMERLVPVYLSPDSALLTALFECDSNNQVIMKAYNELKSAGVESSLSFDNGKLDYKANAKHDTIYIPAKDSIIYVPTPVPGETVYINRLTWWQQAQIYLCRLLAVVLLIKYLPSIWKVILKLLKRR